MATQLVGQVFRESSLGKSQRPGTWAAEAWRNGFMEESGDLIFLGEDGNSGR